MIGIGLLLAGCGVTGQDAGAPSGSLLYIHEAASGWSLIRHPLSSAEAAAITGIPGRLYPGPPDPLGTHALIIAVEEDGAGHRESAWLLPLDGGAPVLLAPPAPSIRSPAWSPDGQWLYVSADWHTLQAGRAPRLPGREADPAAPGAYRSPEIYRLPRAGGEPARLTADPGGSFEPAPSPDGTRLAAGSSRSGNADLWLMRPDGAAPIRLTDHPADDVRPRWRPAPAPELLWISRRSGAAQVWRMDPARPADARPLRDLPPGHEDLDLEISPDGRIAALTVQTGPREIGLYLLPLDGAAPAPVVLDGPGPDEHPAFSPDGRWLAFTSSRAGTAQVWICRVDGSGLYGLAGEAGADWLPRWLR